MVELVRINDLTVRFHTYEGVVQALNGVNLSIFKEETLGIVGETGSGKTVTGLAILRLIMPPGKIEGGEIFFDVNGDGLVDLLKISEAEMRAVRGSQIAMVFQDPMTSLNPVLTIGLQLEEPLMLHLGMTKKQAKIRAAELLSMVGIPKAKVGGQGYRLHPPPLEAK